MGVRDCTDRGLNPTPFCKGKRLLSLSVCMYGRGDGDDDSHDHNKFLDTARLPTYSTRVHTFTRTCTDLITLLSVLL